MSNSKPDDLSAYIKKQLSTLLKQVQQTPPKKTSSLKNIHHIISKSTIPLQQKLSIQRQINKVQSVIQRSQSLQRVKVKKDNIPKTVNKYEKQLFYENMILEEKEINLKNKVEKQERKGKSNSKHENANSEQFLNLIQIFQNLRTQKMKQQHQIQSLSLKAQKLQRLIQLKKENQEKYLHSVKISQKYHQKKEMLEEIRNQVKNAAKENRKKMVGVLMKKFSHVQES